MNHVIGGVTEAEQPSGDCKGIGRNPKAMQRVTSHSSKQEPFTLEGTNLVEQMVERENMTLAYRRVLANHGSSGIDKMTVDELSGYLRTHWQNIKVSLLNGNYQPQAVRGVEIPKPNGGVRLLGIPTVIDRMIQQALYQVLNPIFDPEFSDNSYGFREGKKAQCAVQESQYFQRIGRKWVVDIDLAKFFDEVDHDILMSKIRRKVQDKRILKLIRAYLKAGIMLNGTVTKRDKGTPQGGNLSPLLSNIMLDSLDKELEKRGHSFCRYADDCNIYVKSEQAGKRVMASITDFLETTLKLKVNRDKSAVARPYTRKFLGFSFTSESSPRIRVAKQSIERFTSKVKELFRKGKGRNLRRFIKEDLNPVVNGWINYYRIANVKRFAEELDGWIRRKLRKVIWQQWKRPWTRMKQLTKRGLPEKQAIMSAFNQRGAWWNSGKPHMNKAFPKKYFDELNLVSMLDKVCCPWVK